MPWRQIESSRNLSSLDKVGTNLQIVDQDKVDPLEVVDQVAAEEVVHPHLMEVNHLQMAAVVNHLQMEAVDLAVNLKEEVAKPHQVEEVLQVAQPLLMEVDQVAQVSNNQQWMEVQVAQDNSNQVMEAQVEVHLEVAHHHHNNNLNLQEQEQPQHNLHSLRKVLLLLQRKKEILITSIYWRSTAHSMTTVT